MTASPQALTIAGKGWANEIFNRNDCFRVAHCCDLGLCDCVFGMSRGYSKPASTKEKEIADLEAEVRVLKRQVEAEKRRVAQLELHMLREGTSK